MQFQIWPYAHCFCSSILLHFTGKVALTTPKRITGQLVNYDSIPAERQFKAKKILKKIQNAIHTIYTSHILTN